MRVQEEIKLHVIKTSKLVEELSQNLNGRSVKLGAGREGLKKFKRLPKNAFRSATGSPPTSGRSSTRNSRMDEK
jgi:hypothetical protein